MAQELENARLILIGGDEDALRRRVLNKVTELAGGPQSLEFETLSADESPISHWISIVATLPFLEDRRTVVVRHLLRMSDAADQMKEWTTAFKSLPETARLVLVADDEPGDESKQRKLKSTRDSWEKWIVQCGGLVVSEKVDAKGVVVRLKQEAKAAKISISDSAIELLVEMTAGSLSAGIQELEKLALYSDGTNPIHENDVRRLVVPAREWKIYSLIDSALEGRMGTALQEWKTLIASGAKAAETAIGRLIPTMANQLRMIWLMKVALELGASADHVPESIAARLPKSPSLKDLPDWRLKRLAGPARKHSFEHLSHCLNALVQADASLKGMGEGSNPEDIIERMLISLAPPTSARR